MILNVGKCDNCLVNFNKMLVSSLTTPVLWGGRWPLAGTPHDSYMQLLACS